MLGLIGSARMEQKGGYSKNNVQDKVKVGILGTGKIGTDLLIKAQRSPFLRCVMFAGRNENSVGIQKARELGIPTSTQSVDAFTGDLNCVDLVFDATSADHHRKHAPILAAKGIKVVDMTPARVGSLCVPCLNNDIVLNELNVNMVTCGGQSSIPVFEVLARVYPNLQSVKLHSYVTPDSIGPATIANIDDYYSTTKNAISQFSGVENVNVVLDVDSAPGRREMLSVITAVIPECDLDRLYEPLRRRIQEMQQYVPGFTLHRAPSYRDGVLRVEVAVRGQGDWIPAHAGNLDIINCAAIAVAERYARQFMELGSNLYPNAA
ncbi:MAG: acetaldehyde dehydrogenase [Alteromonadaceae bacterium]|nr:MAG: acetaldehyde dehydrogenase [Alteromonadaceae bacterium]